MRAVCVLGILIGIVGSGYVLFQNSQGAWREKAERMVKTQLVPRGITDSVVLQAMLNTPRHLFVPPKVRHLAYGDHPLPIGYGQTISQPYIVALMTQLLELKGNEKVLEIGTGSGYQAAILAQIVDSVYTIEIVKPLCEQARKRLDSMGYKNVVVVCGDGYKGLPQYAPFDRIIVTAAPPEVPKALLEQLKPGGIMVLPVGTTFQKLIRIHKKDDSTYVSEDIIPVRFVPMIKQEE